MKKILMITVLVGMLAFSTTIAYADTRDYNLEIKQLDRVRHLMLRKYGEIQKTEANTKQILGAVLQVDILIFRLYVERDEKARKVIA